MAYLRDIAERMKDDTPVCDACTVHTIRNIKMIIEM